MYYGARYYDPVVGVFIQADTIVPQPGNPQSLNRYAYTLNNPLRYRDPSGHRVCADSCDVDRSSDEGGDDTAAGSELASVGPIVAKYSAVIVSVELRRGIPRGYLGAIVRHEATNNHKWFDDFRARHLGMDKSIGVAEVKPSSAQLVEGDEYHIPPSQDRATLIDRLSDPLQNIDYAGAYLQEMHDWVQRQAPSGASDTQIWDLAVVGYNLGPGNLANSFEAHGFGGLGNEGQTYRNHVAPYIAIVAAYLYGQ
jgi:uncharacterized protein RhaS with RHS repeats